MEHSNFGVLIVNLGTPNSPTTKDIRAYLREFLQDKRVIDLPRIFWLPILYLGILPLRPYKLVNNYKEIWLEGGSPLLVYSKLQRELLEKRLNRPVELAMRYGKPSIESALKNLLEKNIEKLVVIPLFPQYSATTTAAVFDSLASNLKQYRNLPEIVFIKDHATHPLYLQALSARIQEKWTSYKPQHILLSFHGIPQRYAIKDPYPQRCEATLKALLEFLPFDKDKISMSYQSRFGSSPWLMPYTDQVLEDLAKSGIKRVQVICPGFASDCLETLEEIAVTYKEVFIEKGGEEFIFTSSLNDHPKYISCLEDIALKNV